MNEKKRNHVQVDAAELLRCDVQAIERVGGGGNNEIFRVETTRGQFALKRYIESSSDGRDRMGHECDALSFLASAGETAVPRWIAADPQTRMAAYEWVAGVRVEHFDDGDIDAALALLRRLHNYRRLPAAARLRSAIEECTDTTSLRTQIATRVERLAKLGVGEPRLAEFLANRFFPAWQEIGDHSTAKEPLPRAFQTLSPSDFGAHNTLRGLNGRLVFLDFEYFGWDDPVKLVADVVWHPGSAFMARERRCFIAGALEIFGDDPGYATRFARYAPLFGLRWALIVLSEFIPERWERRCRAGESREWGVVKVHQLAKAIDFVERSLQSLDGMDTIR